jgi:Ca-activated chloride channel family protein
MTFALPDYLYALWLVPLLVVLRVWAEKRGSHAADSMVANRLRDLLIASASPVRAWVVFVLQLIAMAGFIFTLAQPRWGEEKRVITESGRNVLIAVDTSKSMLADDVSPNRLMRAKLAAQDIVEALKEQRVGLIAFAGRAYLQAPLTTDHAAVIESLQSLDTFTIPRGGTAISEAVTEAIEAFDKNKARNHGLIIFSDGGEEDTALDGLLAKAKEKNIIIITVGVGTELGALVPDPDPDRQGDYVRDPATGNPVHVKLEEATLQKMASATNGRYLRLGSQSLTNGVVVQALSVLEETNSGSREESKPIERFYWPLSLSIVALMLSLLLRPAARLPRFAPAVVLAMMFASQPARGAVLSQQETIESAQRAYQSSDFARSRDLYARLLAEDTTAGHTEAYAYGLGASAHQLKDFDRAVDAFSRALRSGDRQMQARAHQSLGNTLYDQGAKALEQQPEFAIKAWNDSISHYESALAKKDDEAVRENMEFVKKQLEQLKEQQEQKQQQQQKQKGDKGDKQDSKDGDKGEEQEGQKGDKGDKKDGQKGDQEEGDQKDGEKQDGQQGDKQDQEKQGKQGKGEEQEGKEGEQIPEGKIQAGEGGKPSEKEQKEMREMEVADQKPDDRTGFSKNEARSLLRTYNDQMQLQFQQRRREASVKRDW